MLDTKETFKLVGHKMCVGAFTDYTEEQKK